MKIHYYSRRLKEKLKLMSEAATTLIEAPSGYGKTTAVKDYLNEREKMGARIFWFTSVVGETAFSSWGRVCRILEQIDPVGGGELMDLGIPTSLTVGEISQQLSRLECDRETYLVIDDYHLLDGVLGDDMTRFLFCHGGARLHLILIAQVFLNSTARTARQLGLEIIGQKDLTFLPEDVWEFFMQAGAAEIRPTQAERICRKAGGWVIALCLQLKHYLETGILEEDVSGDILQLMQSLEWDDLDSECRNLLILISPFESVTDPQICYLLGEPMLPERIKEFLNRANFIRYEPREGRYFPHVILLNLLRKKLDTASLEVKRQVLSKAGSWYDQEGMQGEALECFYRIRDWEGILGLPHVGLGLSRVGDKEYIQIVLELLKECPREVKRRYPITLLRFLYLMYGAGHFREYEQYLKEFREIIEAAGEEQQWLLGEWTLASSYAHYPDLKKMTQVCREAAALLPDGRSWAVSREEPFAFGCMSLWYIFHREGGKADEIGNELEEYLSVYTAITGGRGSGGATLYRGELACMRADFTRAEILAYKAAEEGESNGQITICFGAALLLGRIALARNDGLLFDYATSYIEKKTVFFEELQLPQVAVRMREVVRSMLFSMQEREDKCASWALEGKLTHGLMAVGSLMAGHVYVTHLVSRKEYARAVGLMEYMLTCDPRICNHVARQYIYVTLSLCYLTLKEKQQAVDALLKGIEISLSDGISVNLMRFLPALESLIALPEIQERYGDQLEQLKKEKLAYAVDQGSVYYIEGEPARDTSIDALTAREWEVAQLVAEGYSNKEISQALYISEATVKFHLRTIFSKMQIDKRSKLVKLLS